MLHDIHNFNAWYSHHLPLFLNLKKNHRISMKDDIPPENKIVIKIKTFLRIELIHRNRDRARKKFQFHPKFSCWIHPCMPCYHPYINHVKHTDWRFKIHNGSFGKYSITRLNRISRGRPIYFGSEIVSVLKKSKDKEKFQTWYIFWFIQYIRFKRFWFNRVIL